MTPSQLQRLITPDPTRTDAMLAAYSADRWTDWLRERLPEPPWHRPAERRAWRAALSAALSLCEAPRQLDVTFAPAWIGDTEDDGGGWEASGVALAPGEDGFPLDREAGPLGSVVRARLEVFTLGHLVLARSFSPELTPFRRGPYAAYRGKVRRVLAVHEVVPCALLPAPDRPVPPYTLAVAPALTDEALTAEEHAQLRSLIKRTCFSYAEAG